MNILLALIPISLMLIAVAVAAFVWAVKRGQYEDLDTPALDILREDPNERIAREREAEQALEKQSDAD
ncbi:cbb3-type cytochrome oxidase assembly protein CcoS [Lysobacteraceae bacterium NML71-0210]|nr:cbb3-type cytochrome oxidase assembly protein CcoS [Xanthomonadaceae bacterium NML71-0210]